VQQPQTRYVQRGEVSIAYQVVGDRGPDLIIVPGFVSHLDLQWTDLGFSRFLEQLASFTRLILYDKPGTGLSDPIPHRARELGDCGWHDLLEQHNARVRELLGQFGGRELDTAGDGFFASFEGPGAAVRRARAIGRSLRELDLEIRAGVHAGECERIGDKLGGVAIHVGARIAARASGGEGLVSRTVRDLAAEDTVTAETQLTGPREHMSAVDRALVNVARRAPAVLRLGARLAGSKR
jgi:hypothetical protein